MDYYKTRNISFLVLGILTVAMLTMANTGSVAGLIITIFLLRLMGQGMSTHLAHVAMSRWFSRYRGRALSVANLGYSLESPSSQCFLLDFSVATMEVSLVVFCDISYNCCRSYIFYA